MILYYFMLPFRLILNVFSSMVALIKGPIKYTNKRLDCRQFNQIYYLLDAGDLNDARLQKIKLSFLQKSWGITKYSNGHVKVKADSADLMYATLGALKDYETDNILHSFELALDGIIENDLAIKGLEPTLKEEVFRPNLSLKSNQALAIIAALSLLSKTGSQDAKKQLKELLWKRGYFTQLAFPDLNNLEELTVGFFVLSKTESGFLGSYSIFMVFIYGLLTNLYNRDFESILVDQRMVELEELR